MTAPSPPIWRERRNLSVEEKPDALSDYIAIAEHIERWTGDRPLADRRTAIAIEIDDVAQVVTVLRVFYGGQDYETVLARPAFNTSL